VLYLLDANVLIDANRDYYSIDRVPEFWDWLAYHGAAGDVKVPLEIYEEVKEGTDQLARWIKQNEVAEALRYSGEVDPALVAYSGEVVHSFRRKPSTRSGDSVQSERSDAGLGFGG
jgi:hypothetical protein